MNTLSRTLVDNVPHCRLYILSSRESQKSEALVVRSFVRSLAAARLFHDDYNDRRRRNAPGCYHMSRLPLALDLSLSALVNVLESAFYNPAVRGRARARIMKRRNE